MTLSSDQAVVINDNTTGDITPADVRTALGYLNAVLNDDGTAGTAYGRAFLGLANQAALVALLPAYQPSDADLTAVAALTTTSYGRALLELANQAALMALLSAATTTAAGISELATSAETITGSDTTRTVTPAGAAAAFLALAGGTLTGAVRLPSGATGTPSLTFSASTTTGLYYELVSGILPTLYATASGTTRQSWATGVPSVISGGTEATAADGTGELQIGAAAAANLGMDGNEIQARSGGAVSTLNLNPHGGDVLPGGGFSAPLVLSTDSTVPANYGRYYPEYLEVASTASLTLTDATSNVEVG